jgi:hypothetical protein
MIDGGAARSYLRRLDPFGPPFGPHVDATTATNRARPPRRLISRPGAAPMRRRGIVVLRLRKSPP